MKRLIYSAESNISNELYFYHYDNDKYDICDTISKDYTQDVRKEILEEYSKQTHIQDMSHLVYMVKEPDDDEFFLGYKYRYTVKVNNTSPNVQHPYQMDYSCYICEKDFNRNMTAYNRLHENQKFNSKDYIKLMAKAYLGDATAKQTLKTEYNYSISDNIEYIANSCTVIDILVRDDEDQV